MVLKDEKLRKLRTSLTETKATLVLAQGHIQRYTSLPASTEILREIFRPLLTEYCCGTQANQPLDILLNSAIISSARNKILSLLMAVPRVIPGSPTRNSTLTLFTTAYIIYRFNYPLYHQRS